MNKTKKIFLIISLILIVFLAPIYLQKRLKTDQITVENSGLTIITPVLDFKIEKDKNIIYCSTTQLMWHELSKISNGTVEVENAPWYVEKLNNSELPFISEDAYIALAGYGKNGIVEKVNDLMLKKFNEPSGIYINLGNNEILAYSYMFKELKFKCNFPCLVEPFYFRIGEKHTQVKGFGCGGIYKENYETLKQQVEVLYYNCEADILSEIEFITKLNTFPSTDELIIAVIKPEKSLIETFDKITQLSKINKIRTSEILLQVPNIDFKIIKKYPEIENKKISLNNKNYFIGAMFQNIIFKLNENGVSLKAKSRINIYSGIKPQQKLLLVNRPFIIYLKNKKSKLPYFMAYIGNDELLIKE